MWSAISVTCVKVLSCKREGEVRVSLNLKGNTPNSVRDTPHKGTCATFDRIVHTDAIVTKKGEKIVCITPSGVVHMSANIVITRLLK